MKDLDLIIISPKFRPFNDGLSDYTYYFLSEMRKKEPNKRIGLITSDNAEIIKMFKGDNLIFPIMKEWDGFELTNLISFIFNNKPKKILVQYVPQMYGRAGINFLLSSTILLIRLFTKTKIELMAHELYYPYQSNLKTGFIFSIHIFNLFILSIASHTIYTTTENFVKILKRFPFNKNKIFQLEVGSNIPKHEVIGPVEFNSINIVIFGSLHPTRNPEMIYSVLAEYFMMNHQSKIRIHVIGCLKSEILSIFHHKDIQINKNLMEKFIFHGKLNEYEVGRVFNSCQYSLNYFLDGISSRRGSAIAALNFGLTLISNHNERSDSHFLNQPTVLLLGSTLSEFSKNLISTLQKIENNEIIHPSKKEAGDFYNKFFSWENIIEKYNSITSRS
jgi:hypothetical protein